MKKISAIIFSLFFILTIAVPAFAAPGGENTYVWDYAKVLKEAEERKLNAELENIFAQYGIPAVIVLKKGYADDSSSEYAEMFVKDNEDIFTNGDGIVFVSDFDDGSYYIYSFGKASFLDGEKSDRICDLFNKEGYENDSVDSYLNVAAMISEYCSYYFNSEQGGAVTEENNQKNVTDDADILTDAQEAALTERIDAIREKYDFDIVFHTTNSIGTKTISDYANDYYVCNDYGVGENKDGLVFILNMNNRDYYTSTYGIGQTVFTDYAIGFDDSYINSAVLEYLKDGDYYGAFNKYLDLADIFLEQAKTGEPFDSTNPCKSQKTVMSVIIAELIAISVVCLILFIIGKALTSNMKTNVKNSEAAEYIKPGTFNLTSRYDVYSHNTISRIPKPKPTSSSDSGSSSHTSSSGNRHGGGGKF